MNKEILVNFIKDKLSVTFMYFINTSFIILFFYVYTEGKTPIFYPIEIAIYIYVVYMFYELYKYMNFYKNLIKTSKNPEHMIKAYTNEQEKIVSVVRKIHKKYIYELSNIYYENDKKSKLFSQWVHNIKTPVSIIDIILQKAKEDKNIESNILLELEEQNNRILNNLEQLLNMIRIDDFSKDYVQETVDLGKNVKEVINRKKSEFIYNGVFPKVLYDDEKKNVLSDEKWNKFIIDQIISNAIKYSKNKGNIQNDNKENKYIYFNIVKESKNTILTIRDEGIGIDEYDLKRVFEPFFTGENGRKIKNSTGIGLYICKAVTERLGHKIEIISKKNKGTTVKVKYLSKV